MKGFVLNEQKDNFYLWPDHVSKTAEIEKERKFLPYIKDIDLETPPATLPANPALFARR